MPPLNHFLKSDEGPTTDEEDIGRVNLGELLVRMFSSTLRRNVGNRPFQDFQQCLLNTLSGHITSDGGILIFSANLVYLININDSMLTFLDVPARTLK